MGIFTKNEDPRNRHGRRTDTALDRGRAHMRRVRRLKSHKIAEHNKKVKSLKERIEKVVARRVIRDGVRKLLAKEYSVNWKRVVLMGTLAKDVRQTLYNIKKNNQKNAYAH